MDLHRRLFFLLLVLLPTQLGLHFWPSWSVVLGRRMDYLSPTLYLTDIVIISIISLWFFQSVLQDSYDVLRLIRYTKYILPIFFFALFNIWFAVNRFVAIYDWIKVLEFVLLGLYVVRTKPTRDVVVLGLSVGVLYSSGIAIAQFILQHSVGGLLWWLGERAFSLSTPGIALLSWCISPWMSCKELLRAYATFPHPNVLGGYLAVAMPLLINEYMNNRINETKKIFYGITILLGGIALAATFSRSAWVVAGIAIVYTIARIMNHELRIRNSVYKALVVIIMILYSVFMIQIIGNIRTDDESIFRRVELNQTALTIWLHSPVVGIGLGNFITRLPDTHVSRQGNFLQPVHNIYLLLLSEVGIVGICLIVSLVYLLNHELRIKNQGKISMIHASLFMLLTLGLVDHYPLTLQQGQLLFTILLSLMLQ